VKAKGVVEQAVAAWAPTLRALGGEVPNVDDIIERLRPLAQRIVPQLRDTSRLVNDAIRDGQSVLFEGAQGTLLDIDYGTYPFVTSSSASAAGAAAGSGVGPTRIDSVVGITKAYATRVGGGPFPPSSSMRPETSSAKTAPSSGRSPGVLVAPDGWICLRYATPRG